MVVFQIGRVFVTCILQVSLSSVTSFAEVLNLKGLCGARPILSRRIFKCICQSYFHLGLFFALHTCSEVSTLETYAANINLEWNQGWIFSSQAVCNTRSSNLDWSKKSLLLDAKTRDIDFWLMNFVIEYSNYFDLSFFNTPSVAKHKTGYQSPMVFRFFVFTMTT